MGKTVTTSSSANNELETSRQECPICGRKVKESERYPVYVCRVCRERAVDSDGRKVELFNTSLGGGFTAQYQGGSPADEVISSHTVFIDGIAYHADEARFGGIIITPLK